MGDPIGEATDERRLAHTGLAHDERVVLEATLQDLKQPTGLDVAPDDGIEAPLPRVSDQVAHVGPGVAAAPAARRGGGRRRLTGGLGERADVGAKRAGADPERGEDLAGRPLDSLRKGVEEVLDADGLRLVPGGLPLRAREQIHEARADVGDAAAHPRQALERGLGQLEDLVRVGPGAPEHLHDPAVALEQPLEQVQGCDLGVPSLVRDLLCAGDQMLGVVGITLEVNRAVSFGHGRRVASAGG